MVHVILDGDRIYNKAELFHAFFISLALPPYFGRNLDALHDALTDLNEPVSVVLQNFPALQEHLGSYADLLVRMLKDTLDEGNTLFLS